MTQYETLVLVHPERGPRVKEFIERFQKVIEGQDGTVTHVDEWGMRDLAYRIENQAKGFYALFHYQGTGRTVEELERNLRLTDGILRYITVRADEAAEVASSSNAQSPAAGQGGAPDEERAKTEPQP